MRKNPRPEEENIIEGKINLFRLKKETKAIKDRILENIKNLFKNEKQEVNYHKPEEQIIFGVTIILNMKVTMIEMKHYQLKNILIEVCHI